MEEEPNNSARRLPAEKAKKLRRRVERAEHAAVKGVADGIIGSFLFACPTRPRFSFTSSYEALRITYSFVCVARDWLVDREGIVGNLRSLDRYLERGGEDLVNFPR